MTSGGTYDQLSRQHHCWLHNSGYSRNHRGWITPYNEVIKNPFKAQRTAERINSNLKLSLAANGLAA
ncbi:TPA: DUF1317 family protein [Yersinia enterocolitica]